MIEDARVLRDGFVPREVCHRDNEVDHLSAVLAPIADGEPADTALLTGLTGTGKTCIARFTVDRLRRTHLDVAYRYVNCWQNGSRYRVLYRVLEALGRTIDVHRRSTPHDELTERLRAYDRPPCVVILDEADQLDDRSVLYDLYALSGISMLLIANDTDAVLAGADERLTSRLRGREHVRFDRYGVAELTAILAARARWGLEAGAIDQAELETIADAAAGDARVAISILRSAARRATREERGRINPRNRPRGDPDRPHRSAPKEPRQAERPPADAFRNHRRTRRDRPDRPLQRVREPKTDRTVRNCLRKMGAHYDLVVAEGTSRDRTYRAQSAEADH